MRGLRPVVLALALASASVALAEDIVAEVTGVRIGGLPEQD